MLARTHPDRPALRSYNGSHHCLPEGCPKVLTTFSGDESKTVAYRFNSLGFRGEEFRPDAARHLFVAGCSITFGLGLDYADAWVSVFHTGYAAIHGLPEPEVDLQNFSTSGCSNGFIARTMIGQCLRFRPALALVAMTFADRAETLYQGRSYNIGRWCLRDSFDQGAGADGHTSDLRNLIRQKAKAHYDLYTPLHGDQEALKNALLLQLFFQSRNIPFLIGMIRLGTGAFADDELLAPWLSALDLKHVFTVPYRECLVDQSAAEGHPGTAGSLFIAERFLSRYREIYCQEFAPRDADAAVARGARPLAAEMGSSVSQPEDPSVYPLF
jgi:hypothetical protein